MRLERLSALLALAVLGATAVACGYSPNPVSGALLCSSDPAHLCPQGYTCQADNTAVIVHRCWKNGENPPAFAGTWTFDSTGKLDETCVPGGALPSTSIDKDYVVIMPGTSSALIAVYFCEWNMKLTSGTKASIVPGQTCQTTDATGTMPITLQGDAFDFTTADGLTAVTAASFSGQYTTGAPLTCTFKVTGHLTAM